MSLFNIKYNYLKPFFHALDPETAHHLGINAMRMGLHPVYPSLNDPRLKQTLFGRDFSNPVGLAAGFDKNAEVIAPILKMGFGFTEVGTVTPYPQTGNPRPRVFRDPDNQAVINRMGFPNKGYKNFLANVQGAKKLQNGVIGINIGMNKDQTDPAKDYCFLIKHLAPYADYFTINISSPNTPGLRNLQAPENLKPLLQQIIDQRNKSKEKPALLVKLSPDLIQQEEEDIAAVLMDQKIDGLILSNTTLARPGILPQDFADQKGGLSGQPLKDRANDILRRFYRLTKGSIPLIGVGGISSAADAYERIKSGASLIQIYSALVYHGPELAQQINQGLLSLLEKDGFNHILDAIGKGH